jgi:DNA mismatch endonuclease, patch repair protein
MSRVKNRDTHPEILVRSLLHRMGYRFRLHRNDLPGKPDIVLPKFRSVIFVHGCFWHGHGCPKGKRPSSNVDFWNSKLDGNIDRDKSNQESLRHLGWNVLTVWECETRDIDTLTTKLTDFLIHPSIEDLTYDNMIRTIES